MLLYFSTVYFMLAHCLIDDIFLLVFENIYVLIILLLCLYLFMYFYFLKFIFLEDYFGNKCTIVCFNVFILGKYYIYAHFLYLLLHRMFFV